MADPPSGTKFRLRQGSCSSVEFKSSIRFNNLLVVLSIPNIGSNGCRYRYANVGIGPFVTPSIGTIAAALRQRKLMCRCCSSSERTPSPSGSGMDRRDPTFPSTRPFSCPTCQAYCAVYCPRARVHSRKWDQEMPWCGGSGVRNIVCGRLVGELQNKNRAGFIRLPESLRFRSPFGAC